MRAAVRDRYGTAERVELRRLPVPVPGPGQVRLRVHASSLNAADAFFLAGRPYPLRLMIGLVRPTQPVLGIDVAGVVEAVGPGVTRLVVGDRVFGEARGAYAEAVVAPEAHLAHAPRSLSLEQSATLPIAGLTAFQALTTTAAVQPGQRVLINGAAGGVGSFAVLMAKALGAEVTAVSSGASAAFVRGLGADHVVDYTREDFSQTTRRYDVVLDLVGSAPLTRCLRLLTPTGVYVCSVGRLGWLLRAALVSLVSRGRVKVLSSVARAESLARLAAWVDAMGLAPPIERRWALESAREALAAQCAGRTRGKAVVVIGG
jgi:NADPH:quinone reductase-like Zn-dependent oxidoreductase